MKDDYLGLTHDEVCELLNLSKEYPDDFLKDLLAMHQKLGAFTINGVKKKLFLIENPEKTQPDK
jgi:hypothetical protein